MMNENEITKRLSRISSKKPSVLESQSTIFLKQIKKDLLTKLLKKLKKKLMKEEIRLSFYFSTYLIF